MSRAAQVGFARRQVAFGIILALFACGGAEAQVVQLVRSLETPEARVTLGQKKETLRQAVDFWTNRIGGNRDSLYHAGAAGLKELVAEATAALIADDEAIFDLKINSLLARERRMLSETPGLLRSGETLADRLAVTMALVDPIAHVLVPDVVFGLGAGWQIRESKDAKELAIGTNLLGAGVGTVLGAIGSDKLKQYMLDNMVTGFAVPRGPGFRMSGHLSLGLGHVKFSKDHFAWATLNLEQMQRADARIPSEAVQADTAARSWTVPTLSVGFSLCGLEKLRKRIADGDPTLLFTVGISVPHFYPDNALKTLVALFTDDRKNFVRAGQVRVSLAAYVPLMPFKPKK